MPKPPSLEIYRKAVERFRLEVEKKLEADELPEGTYDKAIREYKRRIDLYKEANKVLKERSD